MVCIYCSGETQVGNSRLQKKSNQVWRRRKCLKCQAVFTTLESVDYATALRVVSGDAYKPFLTDLVYTDVLLAIQHRRTAHSDAREITNTIIRELLGLDASPLFKPSDIASATAKVLSRFDKRAWHRYSAEHPSVI